LSHLHAHQHPDRVHGHTGHAHSTSELSDLLDSLDDSGADDDDGQASPALRDKALATQRRARRRCWWQRRARALTERPELEALYLRRDALTGISVRTRDARLERAGWECFTHDVLAAIEAGFAGATE